MIVMLFLVLALACFALVVVAEWVRPRRVALLPLGHVFFVLAFMAQRAHWTAR